jgi:hypothetical protein
MARGLEIGPCSLVAIHHTTGWPAQYLLENALLHDDINKTQCAYIFCSISCSLFAKAESLTISLQNCLGKNRCPARSRVGRAPMSCACLQMLRAFSIKRH